MKYRRNKICKNRECYLKYYTILSPNPNFNISNFLESLVLKAAEI